MKQITDSAKEWALQGAKIGGLISATAFTLLGIMAYSGYFTAKFPRKRGVDQLLDTLIMLTLCAPTVLVATGLFFGVYKGVQTRVYTPVRNGHLEPVLPLHQSNQTLNHRNARSNDTSCLN